MAFRLIPGYLPIYFIVAASVVGTVFFSTASAAAKISLFAEPWSPLYLLLTPFVHGGGAHLLMNMLMLHFIGGQMLLPLLSARKFLSVLAAAAILGGVANNLLGDSPAVGMSAGIMGVFSCALHRHAHTPIKLLLIHDLFRLRPFPLWWMAVFVVALDITGIILQWGFFAHWAHLAGFAVGGVAGWLIFRRPPGGWFKFKIKFRQTKSPPPDYKVH